MWKQDREITAKRFSNYAVSPEQKTGRLVLVALSSLCLQAMAWGICSPTFAQEAKGPSEASVKSSWLQNLALTAFRQAVSGDAKSAALQATGSVLGTGIRDLLKDAPGWLKRTEVEFDITKYSKPEFSLLTVQPLFQSTDHINTLFSQGRVAYGRGGRTTLNLGAGYRRLVFGEGLMLGANTFFDYEAPYDHRRVGIGGEIRSGPLELNVNHYNAISGKVRAGTGGTRERALDGYDLELGAQIPYLPWARLFGKYFYWDTVDLAKNIQGKRVGLRLRPLPLIEAEVGYTDDNLNRAATFVHIRLSLGLGRTAQDSGVAKIDDVPFSFTSMKEQTLDKVRRENTIRVERSKPAATGGRVVVSRGT